MKFGVREVVDVVLRAKAKQTLGSRTFFKHEPVLYFDSLKTSTLEGAATTVYAQGGRGNARLIAWEGERTLTFTFEDALLSPEGFAILSGADIIEATEEAPIYQHMTTQVEAGEGGAIVLDGKICWNGGRNSEMAATEDAYIPHAEADVFCMVLNPHGEVDVEPCVPEEITFADEKTTIKCCANGAVGAQAIEAGSIVLVDYYVRKTGGAMQMEITAEKFAGNYYLEGATLFRKESTGEDLPAEFIIPNGKIQSNFTFTMAGSGDPSTFSFTMDAFPDYTKFNKTKKVMAALQVIDEASAGDEEYRNNCTVVGE